MEKYSLDANIFIEPWTKFYSRSFTKQYWEILENLAKKGSIFASFEVKREIDQAEDELSEWLKDKSFFKEVNTDVQEKMRTIMDKYPKLVDATKGRSIADPWVIAHAQVEGATVVTLEQKSKKKGRIKIPDVCEAENIDCIDIYKLINRLKIEFTAKIKK